MLCNEGLIKAEQRPCSPMESRSQQMLHDDHVFHKHGENKVTSFFQEKLLTVERTNYSYDNLTAEPS